jgi:hypothetical protein
MEARTRSYFIWGTFFRLDFYTIAIIPLGKTSSGDAFRGKTIATKWYSVKLFMGY